MSDIENGEKENPLPSVPAVIKSWKGVGGGPVAVEIDPNEVQLMAMYFSPVEEIAMFYDISIRQFYRRLAQEPALRSAFNKGRASGKRAVRRKQFTVAVTQGDASMLRWLGQNVLGQSSKHVTMVDDLNKGEMREAQDVEFTEVLEAVNQQLIEEGIIEDDE